METAPSTLVVLLIVWAVSLLTGIALIQAAFKGKASHASSKLSAAYNEIRFRFRLVAGIMLIAWVVSGLVWLFVK